MKYASWRSLVCVAVLLCGIYYTLPNISFLENSSLQQHLPNSKINLGLDLKGGVSLTLGVVMDTAVDNMLVAMGQEIKQVAADDNLLILQTRVVNNTLELIVPETQDTVKLQSIFSKFYQVNIESPIRGTNNEYIYKAQFTTEYRTSLEGEILEQATKTIRNRIDQFGVAEPDIRKQSDNRIQVQLPGIDDSQRAVELLGRTASLTFHLVRDDINPNNIMPPVGTAFFPMKSDRGSSTSQLLLDTAPLMTGVDITGANPTYDDRGQVQVSLNFNSKGASDFERVTGANVNKRIAIVLDGTIFSAPNVNERIAGGRASISGSSDIQEATDLAIILRSGALPAPVEVLEERTVGPSLGKESIQSGLTAALIGALLVIIIMPLYYGKSGLIADAMLCFTMLLLTAGLGMFGATLTLPGIAGIVLTIGMAVDANVLIYERIREELKKGLRAVDAVEAGFSRAAISIMDSNITTMIAALVLYQFGTGPIRGFAVTLGIGIVASMFTAIFVSRCVFAYMLERQAKNSPENEPTLSI